MYDNNATPTVSLNHSGPAQALLRRCLEYAVLAPSGHNTQPWLFRLGDTHIDLIADRTRRLPVVDPFDRELTISCGAALDHLVTAGRYFGSAFTIEVSPDSTDADLLARCRIGDAVAPNATDKAHFDAIAHRHTARTKYVNKALPAALSRRCVGLAKEAGVELSLITNPSARNDIAELVAEGDRIQFADPRFRAELASWVHSRRRSTRDGMSGSGFGMPDILSPLGALVIRTFDLGKGVSASDKETIAEGSPTLAVFSSTSDSVDSLLATGQALSKVLLTLTHAGAVASYLNPPVELQDLRPRLQKLAQCKGIPQLLLRFGFGPAGARTVRRAIDDVVVA